MFPPLWFLLTMPRDLPETYCERIHSTCRFLLSEKPNTITNIWNGTKKSICPGSSVFLVRLDLTSTTLMAFRARITDCDWRMISPPCVHSLPMTRLADSGPINKERQCYASRLGAAKTSTAKRDGNPDFDCFVAHRCSRKYSPSTIKICSCSLSWNAMRTTHIIDKANGHTALPLQELQK